MLFLRCHSNIWHHSDFVSDLHIIWRQRASVHEHDRLAIQVVTWYLAPGRERHRCFQPRRVTLAEDFANWEMQLRQAWSDVDVHQLPVDFPLVYPMPPFLETDAAVHIVLVQQPIESAIGCLVTILDAAGPEPLQRQAVIMNEAIFAHWLPSCTCWFQHVACADADPPRDAGFGTGWGVHHPASA